MLAIPVHLQLRFLSSCDSNPYGVLPIKKESYPSDLEKKILGIHFVWLRLRHAPS